MSELYTCPERVERDGYLIAFEGEKMSMEDARHRGLIKDETAQGETPDANPDATPDANPDATPDANPDATPDANPDANDLSKLKKPELLALCEERGITVPKKATVDQLIELLSE